MITTNETMNKDKKLIDTKQIDAISGSDNDFKMELVNIFLGQIPEFTSKMNTYLAEEKWELLAREAHTAKSSVLTFGMETTGSLLKSIQLNIQNGQLESIEELVDSAINDLNDAVSELEVLKQST